MIDYQSDFILYQNPLTIIVLASCCEDLKWINQKKSSLDAKVCRNEVQTRYVLHTMVMIIVLSLIKL